jgi:hypothetical protein
MVLIPNAPRMGDMPKSDPLPEGLYFVRCSKETLKEAGPNAKNPGAPMLVVELTVFGPESAEVHHGRKLFENFILEGPGMFRLRAFLTAAGKDEDFVLEDSEDLLELEVAVVTKLEVGRTDPVSKIPIEARSRITRFLPLESVEAE